MKHWYRYLTSGAIHRPVHASRAFLLVTGVTIVAFFGVGVTVAPLVGTASSSLMVSETVAAACKTSPCSSICISRKGHKRIDVHREWLMVLCRSPAHVPPWRNRLARSAVNRKVGGSSPPGGVFFWLVIFNLVMSTADCYEAKTISLHNSY